ncbi:MAG: hypothetical protein NVSMB9_34510 [Isosphaeraceae bacterium]
MTPSLERLNELVRQAEARGRAKKLGAEVEQAAAQLREAEHRARDVSTRLREVRPAKQRAIEQAEADELQLKELVKKLAQFKASLDPGADAEALIDNARAEIERARRDARAELDEIARAADDGRKALRAAIDHYQQLRRELDRLQPQLADAFSADDRLLWEAETLFPGGELQAQAREVEAGSPHFGMLSRAEQYAQLKIWIGRYRQFQAAADPEPPEETQTLSLRVFHQLKNLSKQHEPGYIEAFRQDFHTDWAAYVADAQEQLLSAAQATRLSRDREHQRGESQARDLERQVQSREAGRAALSALKALMTRTHLPDEGLDAFLESLKQVVNGLGASDPELLELVLPFREHVNGGNGLRALRRNLDRLRQEASLRDGEADPLRAQFEDLLAFTQGRRALMVGGSVREDVRRTLQRLFDFDRLDWEPYEDAKPAALDSLEQRVRNHGVDLVLLLKNFIGHHVTERLRPLCQQNEIPCLMVDHGYGPSQVGEALRRGLVKSA